MIINPKDHSQAYLVSLELYFSCCKKGQLKRVILEQYSEMSYERVDSGFKEKFVPESVTIISTELFDGLSARAARLVRKMVGELYMNNALWYFDHTTSKADYAAIKELRDKRRLFKTEDPRIHYVNPDFMRRGSKPQVLACTTKELEGIKRVTRDNIRNLGYREGKIGMNMFDMHQLPPTKS